MRITLQKVPKIKVEQTLMNVSKSVSKHFTINPKKKERCLKNLSIFSEQMEKNTRYLSFLTVRYE